MDKLKMQSPDAMVGNVAKIAALFPQCVTERMGKDGHPELAVDFDKLREEYHEFVHECPPYVLELHDSEERAKRFMEEGYDLLQALCQVLMMGEYITGVSHDTMVASTLLKCLSRDDSFYRG